MSDSRQAPGRFNIFEWSGVTVVIVRKDLAERADKNLPTTLQYRTFIKEKSLYNTPPTFAIYIVGRILSDRRIQLETDALLQFAQETIRSPPMLQKQELQACALSVLAQHIGVAEEFGDGAHDGQHLVGADKRVEAEGEVRVGTAVGKDAGVDLDRVVLRSAPGGGPLTTTPAVSGGAPTVTVVSEGRVSYTLRVDDATKPFWLVLGQSHLSFFVLGGDITKKHYMAD